MSARNDLADKLEKLAHAIADDVLDPAREVKLEDKIAALQRLSAFYGLLHRIEPDGPTTSSFGGYRNAIASTIAGGAGGSGHAANGANGAERPYAIGLADDDSPE